MAFILFHSNYFNVLFDCKPNVNTNLNLQPDYEKNMKLFGPYYAATFNCLVYF